jgi:hypothetical protein
VGLSSVALGYVRNFSSSYLGSFYIRDRGYVNFNYFVGGMILFSAEGGIGRYNYPEYQYENGVTGGFGGSNSAFAETRVDLRVFGEYRFSDRLAANATLLYDQRVVGGDLGTTSFIELGTAEEDVNYSRVQTWIAARLFW